MSALKDKLLLELASCWRGDMSYFDGRGLQGQLQDWVSLKPTRVKIVQFRSDNDMCPSGQGHWVEYCGQSCNPAVSNPKENEK